MAFYMKPGQGPKMKTGNGLPSGLMGGPKMKPCGGPMMHEGDGKKHTNEKSGTGDPVLDRYKKKYPDSTVTVKNGKKKKNPYNKTKKQKQYSVTGKDGSSFTVVPGKKVKDKSMSTKDAINKTLKDERTGS